MKTERILLCVICMMALALGANAQDQPSAAAIAADPLASSQNKVNGYSKTISQIRAAYEYQDPTIFIHQPYYKGENKYFYFLAPDEENARFHGNIYAYFQAIVKDNFGRGIDTPDNYFSVPEAGGKVVPYGDHSINAGFAEILADQAEYQPFDHYLRAKTILKVFDEIAGRAKAGYYTETQLVENGKVVATKLETEQARLERLHKMEHLADQAILDNAPFALIPFVAGYRYANYAKRKEAGQFLLTDYWEYQWCVELMLAHKDGGADNPEYIKHSKQLEAMAADAQEFMVNAWKKASERSITMAQMPKPAKSDASLEAQMKKIAGANLKDATILKAIIKGADWSYDRDALGRIIDRYHTAYIVYKLNGQTRMIDMGFKQNNTGGSYGPLMLRGIGMEKAVITDYK